MAKLQGTHLEKQNGVRKSGALSFALIVGSFVLTFYNQPTIFSMKNADRLSQLKWVVLISSQLIWRIICVVRYRFKSPNSIDGSALTSVQPPEDLRILHALLQNTLEQSVVAVVTHIVWIATMPATMLCLQPLAAIFFFVGRVCFANGYEHGAPSRSFGFALTVLPTAIMCFLEMCWLLFDILGWQSNLSL